MGDTAINEPQAQTQEMNPLGTQPVGKLMIKFALPSVISLVVNSLYNMVDQIFIGNGVGYLGNAATNVIAPLMTLVLSIGLLIGDGTASYMSLMLGRGEPEKAARGTGNAIFLVVIVGILFTIFFSIFLEPLCWAFGATETNISYCLDYGRVIAAGFLAFMICSAFGSIIRADGRPGISMIGLLIGCITNIILDPIFIFVCEWGVRGAAIATVIGQILNAIFFIICCFRFKTVKLTFKCFLPKGKVCGKIATLGISSFITQAATVAVMIIMNNLLVKYGEESVYGPDIPLAVFGIVMKISLLLNSILIGIATGCQPIWGYNYGSGQYDRVKKCFKRAYIIATVIAAIALVMFQLFPSQIIGLFGDEGELYMEYATKFLRIYLIACIIIPYSSMMGIFFQALGKPVRATLISLSRQVIFLIPAMFIFGFIGGLDGLTWTAPFADVCAGIFSIIILAASWRGLFRKKGAKTENE